jgi:hypothetical protein
MDYLLAWFVLPAGQRKEIHEVPRYPRFPSILFDECAMNCTAAKICVNKKAGEIRRPSIRNEIFNA